MAATTRIFLCRHAHPDNPDGVFYGHLPGFGLSARGVRQAIGLGDHLARYPVRRFYASPLQRAQETAQLAIGQMPEAVPLETREELVEAAFGRYLQGVKQGPAVVVRPLFWVHLASPGRLSIDETVTAMAARVQLVLAEALESCRGEAAAVISHADPIKAFWNRHIGRADWRFHFLGLAKGGFLELVYEAEELVVVHPHAPLEAAGA
jgi:broad specificity phosphatase PhoE